MYKRTFVFKHDSLMQNILNTRIINVEKINRSADLEHMQFAMILNQEFVT